MVMSKRRLPAKTGIACRELHWDWGNLYIKNVKINRVLTIEEFSNTAWRVISEVSVDRNRKFKLDNES